MGKIASENTDVLVVFCKDAGHPIRARSSGRSRHCDYWTPAPPPHGYLIASVPTLIALGRDLLGEKDITRLWTSGYCCREPGSSLFEPCRFDSHDRECNRLQTVQKRFPRKSLQFKERGLQGAVVFGDGKRHRRQTCSRFVGYSMCTEEESDHENTEEQSASIYPWVQTMNHYKLWGCTPIAHKYERKFKALSLCRKPVLSKQY
jgi:hypothetical protein